MGTIEIVRNDAPKEQLAPGFEILEIPFKTGAMSVARIKLTSRYPKEGTNVLDSDMVVYVIEGGASLIYGKVAIPLFPGQTVHIPRGEHYYWTTYGNGVELFVVNSPPFDKTKRKI